MEAKDTKWEPKVALVTGANKGIGFETARFIAKAGVTVFLGARDKTRGEEAVRKLQADKLDVRFVQLDVTSAESIEAARKHIAEATGTLDILVNNAGRLPDMKLPTVVEQMKSCYETNVFGLAAVTEAFTPLLLEATAKPARVINVSSGTASLGGGARKIFANMPKQFVSMPFAYTYPSSKAAVNGLSLYHHLLMEANGRPIVVVAIDPGHTGTDFNNYRGPIKVEVSGVHVAKYATGFGDGKELGGKFIGHEGELQF